MTGFLIDTSILSAFAPDRPLTPPQAADWLRREADRLFVPVIAVQEIRKGIRKLDRAGGHDRAARLLAWLSGIVEAYGERVLPIDLAVALEAGILEDEAVEAGCSPGLADILVAATARAHGLTVLTANARHFQALGVAVVNPFDPAA